MISDMVFEKSKKYRQHEILVTIGDYTEVDYTGQVDGYPLMIIKRDTYQWRFIRIRKDQYELLSEGNGYYASQ